MTSARSRAVVLLLALAGAAIARFIAWRALGDVPHVMDEVAYDLQAKTFGEGALALPVRLPRGAFTTWFVDDRTETFSIFPPGWPALLAPFAKLGLRAWVNPALHALTTFVVGAIGRRLGGPRARLFAAGAWALSPQAIVLAASLMSHTLVAAAASIVVLAALSRRAWLEVAGGAALGVLVLTRPLCAVSIAGALVLVLVVRRRRVRLADLARFAAPVVVALGLLAAYNHRLTGSATRFPQTAFFDEHAPPLDDPFYTFGPGCNALGFGHACDRGVANARHDLANAASNTGDNVTAWLLLAGGGPAAFLLTAWAIARAKRRRRLVLAAGAPVLISIVLYALYWYAGTCFGARFYHAAIPSLLALAGVGLSRVGPRVARAGVAAAAIAINAFVLVQSARELSGYWGTDARFARLAEGWSESDALVMVAFRRVESPHTSYTWTSFLKDAHWRNDMRVHGALHANRARLDGKVVFARFHPGLVRALRARFPARETWLYVLDADDTSRDSLARYDGAQSDPPPKDNFGACVVPAAP